MLLVAGISNLLTISWIRYSYMVSTYVLLRKFEGATEMFVHASLHNLTLINQMLWTVFLPSTSSVVRVRNFCDLWRFETIISSPVRFAFFWASASSEITAWALPSAVSHRYKASVTISSDALENLIQQIYNPDLEETVSQLCWWRTREEHKSDRRPQIQGHSEAIKRFQVEVTVLHCDNLSHLSDKLIKLKHMSHFRPYCVDIGQFTYGSSRWVWEYTKSWKRSHSRVVPLHQSSTNKRAGTPRCLIESAALESAYCSQLAVWQTAKGVRFHTSQSYSKLLIIQESITQELCVTQNWVAYLLRLWDVCGNTQEVWEIWLQWPIWVQGIRWLWWRSQRKPEVMSNIPRSTKAWSEPSVWWTLQAWKWWEGQTSRPCWQPPLYDTAQRSGGTLKRTSGEP